MMTTSRTQQALALLAADPQLTPHAVARQLGLSPSAVYRALARRQDKVVCPCCRQIVRDGFHLKPAACMKCGHPPGEDWLDGGETCPRCKTVQ